ncbi:MAG TPA: hypothetical protein VFI65_02085 [Streptosporangiaceae bacterium]|nr:hypothetical protein [Streptosporangiaceae bacterium]
MTVLNRIGDRLANLVLPKAEAGAITCGQECFCHNHKKYFFSCLNNGCVVSTKSC